MEAENANKEVNVATSHTKTSRWIGVTAIVLFFILDGCSVCPWYLWATFGLLVLITAVGILKWGQAILGMIILIWGTSLSTDGYEEFSDTQYETEQSTYDNTSDNKLSESESLRIDREIDELETMYAQFQRAYERGNHAEAKQLSDLAESKYKRLKQKNLTKEQQVRLSNLFSL